MASWTDRRAEYEALARRINPRSRVTTKDHWLWTALWVAGVVFTLGIFALAISRRRFLVDFATTIGPVQGYPKEWPSISQSTIVHECEHTVQVQRLGFGNPWVGLLPYALLYLLLPLPVGLAWFRYWFERSADERSWRYAYGAELMSAGAVIGEAARRATVVSGGSYFWSWPRGWALRGYAAAAGRVINPGASS